LVKPITAALERAVGAGVRIAFLAGDRGNVHDAPVILLEHDGNDCTIAEEHAVDVHFHDLPPRVYGIIPHRLVGAGDPGRAYERIDAAQRGRGRSRGRVDAGSVGDVDDARVDVGSQRYPGFVQRGCIAIPHAYAAATGDEALRDRKTDACRAARDDRAAAAEVELIHVPPHSVITPLLAASRC